MKVRFMDDEDLGIGEDGTSSLSSSFLESAKRIVDEALSDSSMPAIEQAARLAGAYLLQEIASGKMGDRDALTFLRALFQTKTPAPVQRIEQRTHADFRILFKAAIDDNPDVLDRTLTRALAAHDAICDRLSLPPSLQMPERVEGEIDEAGEGMLLTELDKPVSEMSTEWKPGDEPLEIAMIRAGKRKPTEVEAQEVEEEIPDRHKLFKEFLRKGL